MDYTGGKLGVVYHLHSMKWNHKIVIKVEVPAENPHVPSVESVWKTANWHEREAYDMIGVIFNGHPDLRRMLLPEDWVGHPLRKDYQVQEFYNGMKVPY
jgi:NADH-quinone oxidoreductase subunit C